VEELVGSEESSQNTAVKFNWLAWGSLPSDTEAVRTRNLKMVQWLTRSTLSDGRRKSDEGDLASPVGLRSV
jgi:hypothetical protein